MARVAAAPLGIAIGLTGSACFIKPEPPGGSAGGDAGVGDVLPVGDGPILSCPVRDDFSSGMPLCGTWGVREGSAASGGNQNFYRSSAGQLVMSSSGSGGSGACQSVTPVPFTEVSVDILQAVTVNGARTGLQLTFGDSSTFAVELKGLGGSITLVVNNDGTEVPVGGFDSTMTRFRLTKNGASYVSLLAANVTGTSSISNSYFVSSDLDNVRVRLYTGFGSNTQYVLSEFDNLDGCAP